MPETVTPALVTRINNLSSDHLSIEIKLISQRVRRRYLSPYAS